MKLKVSNYRPNRIIARDPNESTYKVGDDKFPTIAHVDNIEHARHIVLCVNSHDELIKAFNELLSYTEACERLLNASPAGQVLNAQSILAKHC